MEVQFDGLCIGSDRCRQGILADEKAGTEHQAASDGQSA